MHTSPQFDYEPPWLIRLREVDPKLAEPYDTDPAAVSKLDRMLRLFPNDESRIWVLQECVEQGFNVNDPGFNFALLVGGVQQIVSRDFKDTIANVQRAATSAHEGAEAISHATVDAVKAITDAGAAGVAALSDANDISSSKLAEMVAQIKTATDASVAGIIQAGEAAIDKMVEANAANRALLNEIKKTTLQAIKKIESSGVAMQETFAAQVDAIRTIGRTTQEAIENLPTKINEISASLDERARTINAGLDERTQAIAESIDERAKDAIDTAVAQAAKVRIEEATETALRETNATVIKIADEAKTLHDTMRPLRAQVERLAQSDKILVVGRAFAKREYYAALIGMAGGVVFGLLLYAAAANLFHVGIDPMLVSDAYAGRTYQAVWAGVSGSCRTEITNLVNGLPANSAPRPTHR
jgi:hypothetical protein